MKTNNGTSDDFSSEFVRYWQSVYKSFNNKYLSLHCIILYTCKNIMCSFQVNANKQSCNAFWNVAQDSLNLAFMCGVTFGIKKALKYCSLSMTNTKTELLNPVMSKTGSTTENWKRMLLSKRMFLWKPTLIFKLMPEARRGYQKVMLSSL